VIGPLRTAANKVSALKPLLIPVMANQNRPARGACTAAGCSFPAILVVFSAPCQSASGALALRPEFLRSSCPGLTRASIHLQEILRSGMDCRVKPGNDEKQLSRGINHGDP
jgi:hypothetical protein